MLKPDQQLKQKYSGLHIIEDYPDGTEILFTTKQCKILASTLYAYALECGESLDDTTDEHFAFQQQLYKYLEEKI